MKLRFKLLSGFLIMALMLLVAGVWSLHEQQSMSLAVQDLLDDNYKSISSAKAMLEALERDDSGILLLMLGNWSEGQQILASSDSSFNAAFKIASGNITIPGEQELVDSIMALYSTYRAVWERHAVGQRSEGDLNWYLDSAHVAFLKVKSAVSRLMTLNDSTMFQTASKMREKANRAVMPSIVAMAASLLFSILFSYFINLYVIRPINQITEGVGRLNDGEQSYDVKVQTNDELSSLSDSIKRFASRQSSQ